MSLIFTSLIITKFYALIFKIISNTSLRLMQKAMIFIFFYFFQWFRIHSSKYCNYFRPGENFLSFESLNFNFNMPVQFFSLFRQYFPNNASISFVSVFILCRSACLSESCTHKTVYDKLKQFLNIHMGRNWEKRKRKIHHCSAPSL